MSTDTELGNASRLMTLPAEILDMILSETAAMHLRPKTSSHRQACHCRPQPLRARLLCPLRLVNARFNAYFTPIVFSSITSEGSCRHATLHEIASSPLSTHVRGIQLAISPCDFGSTATARFLEHGEKTPQSTATMDAYFAGVEEYLVRVLRRLPRLRTLSVSVDYKGVALELYSANKVLSPCLTTLMRCVKRAQLPELEELRLGMMYHGGYADFFSAAEIGLDGMARRPRTVSIKLSDGWGNFTLMPLPK